MKIGVLGSGNVAKTLAYGFSSYAHEVMLGTRTPGKLSAWAGHENGIRVGNVAETAEFGELCVLAVRGTATADVLQAAAPNLAGKIVIDVTNPIADLPPVNGVLRYFTTLEESLMERSQRAHPDVYFVKALNSVGRAQMVNPRFPGGPPTMFICGNDEAAKKIVRRLLDQFGWDTADMGSMEAARAIEPLCMLWCIPGLLHDEWEHAFKILRL